MDETESAGSYVFYAEKEGHFSSPSFCPSGPYFIRGETNADGGLDLSDAVTILLHLFCGREVACLVAADTNDDEAVDIADAVYLLSYLFGGESPPPAPGPCDYPCGPDRTVSDDLRCSIADLTPLISSRKGRPSL